MKNLSVVIITKNEVKNIERCLTSINDISKDIIILDSESSDDTELICKNFPVRFIKNRFIDYSTQKNFGNEFAKNDYILSIDADEVLSKELLQSINETCFNNNDNKAYSFNRLNHHCGKPIKYGGWYPDKKLRIWNKHFGQWEGTIHEELVFKEPPQIAHLKGDLLHFTYNNKKEHIAQAKKFSKLNAESDYKKGKKTNLGLAYLSSLIRFIFIYFIKLGFLDGKIGFFIAKTTAHATFLRKKELISLKINK
ncbi:MAG: glycosyltransferase family 2 protein [Bacteroidales bacterium]|nr:glycosyltransferase family 2 protein [Bacteroidales bacterium]MDD4217841.1 glycosyltransferase family 2 protein [Bacteroidales bacterium]MDY0141416.1 glycosyltransferase family 2 protein [Bacteroidales bacterium]